MDKEKTKSEFKFIRDKIKTASLLLISDDENQAMWILGCLHEICNNYIEKLEIYKD